MEILIIISVIVSLSISYFIIYLAVKNAVLNELKKTNDLLVMFLKQNNQDFQYPTNSDINKEDKQTDSFLDLNSEIYPKTKNVLKYYTSDAKTLLVFTDLNTGHANGDLVFIGKTPAKDGKYKVGKSAFIYVENGKVIEP